MNKETANASVVVLRKKSSPRYDHETREVVALMVRDLRARGLSYAEIAEQLHRDGVKTPTGKKPDILFVSNMLSRGKRWITDSAEASTPETPRQGATAKPAATTPPGKKWRPFLRSAPAVDAPKKTDDPTIPTHIAAIINDSAISMEVRRAVLNDYAKSLKPAKPVQRDSFSSGEYKGQPVATIWLHSSDKKYPFIALGLRKAQLVVKYADQIKEFVESHS